MHSGVVSPDLVPNPGVFKALGRQHALDLLEFRGVIADLVDPVIRDRNSLAVVVTPAHSSVENNNIQLFRIFG